MDLFAPNLPLRIPSFTPSGYLSPPLASLLAIARNYAGLGLLPAATDNDEDACAVCLERRCTVAAEVCGHEMCCKCALDLCTVMRAYEASGLAGGIPCPLCRSGIASFRKAINASAPPSPSLSCSGGILRPSHPAGATAATTRMAHSLSSARRSPPPLQPFFISRFFQ